MKFLKIVLISLIANFCGNNANQGNDQRQGNSTSENELEPTSLQKGVVSNPEKSHLRIDSTNSGPPMRGDRSLPIGVEADSSKSGGNYQ